jgi:hypothetical protein
VIDGLRSRIARFFKIRDGRAEETGDRMVAQEPLDPGPREEDVEQAAEDSFPASDPPAWTSTGVKHG